MRYYDFGQQVRDMEDRVRLCPYYFVIGDEVRLGGILATAVSLEKKIIHGMADAVMAPVAVRELGGRVFIGRPAAPATGTRKAAEFCEGVGPHETLPRDSSCGKTSPTKSGAIGSGRCVTGCAASKSCGR